MFLLYVTIDTQEDLEIIVVIENLGVELVLLQAIIIKVKRLI